HDRELQREQSGIARLLEHRPFLRGVTLSSPELAQNLGRLEGKAGSVLGRKEKRLALTLLRYASRAALKLSPYSSLTRTGLALVQDDLPSDRGAGFELAGAGSWRERSSIHLRREILAQCLCLLLRCHPFREHLPVRVNGTLEIGEGGHCSFLRPGHWEFEDASRSFLYREDALVRVRLEGSLPSWLIAELGQGAETHGRLLARLRAAANGSAAEVEENLATLLDLGFLTFVFPWAYNEPDLERKVLDFLEALPGDADWSHFVETLRGFLESLGRYSVASSPVRSIAESQERLAELFQAVKPLAAVDPDVVFEAGHYHFEESVFLLPRDERVEVPGIARISRQLAGRLLQDLEPLVRLSSLDGSHYDFLYTLADFASRHWPGAAEVGFLDLYRASQRLLKEYFQYRAGLGLHLPLLAPGFNPLGLESVRDLVRRRQEVARRIGECLREGEGEQRLCGEALGSLLDCTGGPRAAAREFCAFLQPLDDRGTRWVLNGLFEGNWSLSSRYTSAMDEGSREMWVKSFTPRSLASDGDGESVELVDVSCPERRALNVHATQTHRVLRLPGEFSSLPPERVLSLRDLRVRLRGPDRFPQLTDSAGQRLVPVQFGALSPRLRPLLFKLLSVFGSGELRLCPPRRRPRETEGGQVVDRHSIGSVVYARRAWHLDPAPLVPLLQETNEARIFETIHRWRMANGAPDRVFVRRPSAGSLERKPQYIDFTSASFVQILTSIIGKESSGSLVLEEALPALSQFPSGEGRWGMEIQLESAAFSNPSESAPQSLAWCGAIDRPGA
ncbi:MAG: lantibiotic dehydratase, partial [Thermoanaerobaculia bacterium]